MRHLPQQQCRIPPRSKDLWLFTPHFSLTWAFHCNIKGGSRLLTGQSERRRENTSMDRHLGILNGGTIDFLSQLPAGEFSEMFFTGNAEFFP